MTSFIHSLFSILGGFLQSFITQFQQQLSALMQYLGYQIGGFFIYWGNSVSGYGILIPALLVVSVGLAIMGVMGEFVLLDGANKVVGG
jgi:hypothetical protein